MFVSKYSFLKTTKLVVVTGTLQVLFELLIQFLSLHNTKTISLASEQKWFTIAKIFFDFPISPSTLVYLGALPSNY